MRTMLCCLLVLALSAVVTSARAGEWFDLNDQALEKLDFEGLKLPRTPSDLQREFPQAQREPDRFDAEVGLECFVVRGLKNVDAARFYYFQSKLYQLELDYDLARVQKLGGMQALVRTFIDKWGHADHVGEQRRSWYRPRAMRRADLYTWPQRAQLAITDTTLMDIVARRVKAVDEKERIDVGL